MAERIRRGRIGEPKVVPVRDYQWTVAARNRFLDHLAATCNVTAACAAAGRHPTGAYALRRRDAGFAAAWQAALDEGYVTLEAAVLEQMLAPLQPREHPLDPDAGAGRPFDLDSAMRLLAQHRTQQGRGARPARRGGPAPRTATAEETDAAILAALAQIDARTKAADRRAAAQEEA